MEGRKWKETHNIIMKNKRDIIEKYNKNIPIKEIARLYEVSIACIRYNLKKWGVRKKHGIKYLLAKYIREDSYGGI